jgi:hypothetical protein
MRAKDRRALPTDVKQTKELILNNFALPIKVGGQVSKIKGENEPNKPK